jgi:hypothetical protein
MRYTTGLFLLAWLCITLITAVSASAQQYAIIPPTVTLSAGYSNLQMQKATNLFYDHDGSYLDADFAWRLPVVIPLQAGFGLTGSGSEDRQSIYQINNSNFYDSGPHLYSDLGLFEIEPRIGLKIGRTTGFFLLPRLGAGLLINSYGIDQTFNSNGNTYLSTQYHTGAAFEIRPAIQAGFSWGHASAGIEASYLAAWGDFGGLGHNAQEFRAGLFLTFSP